MKTLLNKKLAIVLAVILCINSVKAQIPERLKNLPPFKMRALMLSSLNKSHIAGKLNDRLCSSDAPCLKSQITLGGTGYDFTDKLIETHDGGFIVCGGTNSDDGDFSVPAANGEDAYIAKYNKFRQLEWAKTFGGTGDDFFNDIAQTYDGGYIMDGYTSSTDGDVTNNHGAYDVWVVKVSKTGNMEWQKSLGGSGYDLGDAVVQTFYGGYAIAGFTSSTDGDISGNHNTDGNFDAWLVELGFKGNVLFQHCYGGSGFDGFVGITKSDLGSLILGGETQSNDGDETGNHGGSDAWVIKINAFGKIVWQKTVGGSNDESPSNGTITKTTDGNIVIDGYSNSPDGDIQAKNDTVVSYVTKLNAATGNIIWSKSFAEPRYRAGFGVFATRDGGVVESCSSAGNGFDGTTYDALVSKIDKNGKEEWYKKLGGSNFDGALSSGYESPDGSLNVLGQTASTDGDVKNNHGAVDTWIIKLGPCGDYVNNNSVASSDAIAAIKNNTTTLSAYPNPVSNSTTISFNLQQTQKVSVQIYDMNGRLIKTLAGEEMQQGAHQVTWNARDKKGNAVNAGVYLLQIKEGNVVETKKISVVK